MDGVAIVIADRDGVIRVWTAGAERMFGHAAADAIGERLDLIVPEDYREAHWAGFKRAMATGAAGVEGQATPFPARLAAGDTVEIAGRLTLVRQAEGAVLGAMVVFG